jgi:hypothetical protein
VNNGNGATVNAGLRILDNVINNISGGGWVHAIGLEANTPAAVVLNNSITGLNSASPDSIAVWFEVNSGFATSQVHGNNFNITIASYGMAVQPSIPGTGSVDGSCNWWGAPNGPGPVGPGSGAKVSPRVTFSPWLTSPAPSPCNSTHPTDKDQCKNDGWKTMTRTDFTTFKNQGDCVSYTNNGR